MEYKPDCSEAMSYSRDVSRAETGETTPSLPTYLPTYLLTWVHTYLSHHTLPVYLLQPRQLPRFSLSRDLTTTVCTV
jgi:hypothetical protein